MKIAIMQPYFFPYLGYFSLIKHTHRFILLDEVQYIRHRWIDRNRILKPGGGWQYIKVPVRKHSRDTSIKDIEINNDQDWRTRILAQLQHYKKNAPNFTLVKKMVEEVLDKEYRSVVQLDLSALKAVCECLKLRADLRIFSEEELNIIPPGKPDEWALNICKVLPGEIEYWNPSGGRELFDKNKYRAASIELRFFENDLRRYDQKQTVFEPGLSIIDVLMFNDPDAVNLMLDDFVVS